MAEAAPKKSYQRYAIYEVPSDPKLRAFGAKWLGWDIEKGSACASYAREGLNEITSRPRKYGFHATLKAPFALAQGFTEGDLDHALEVFSKTTPIARSAGLEVARIGRFLALTPFGDLSALSKLASNCVTSFDQFRAPLSEEDFKRRDAAHLTAIEKQHLRDWGYPYVLEAFRFHLTLSGPLKPDQFAQWFTCLEGRLPPLPAPYEIDAISLCGERIDGQFEVIKRYPLSREYH